MQATTVFPLSFALPPVAGAVERGVRTILRRHWVPAQRLLATSQLAELLADATERNEVFCELEIRFRIELNDQELGRLVTLGDLLTYVDRQRVGAARPHA